MEVSIPEITLEVPVWLLCAFAGLLHLSLSLGVTALWRKYTRVNEWDRGPMAVAVFLFWPVLLPLMSAVGWLVWGACKVGDGIDAATEYLAGR